MARTAVTGAEVTNRRTAVMAVEAVTAAEAANRRTAAVDAGRAGGFMVGGTFVPRTGTYLSPAAARVEREEGERGGFLMKI